jgi:hypothetical protein
MIAIWFAAAVPSLKSSIFTVSSVVKRQVVAEWVRGSMGTIGIASCSVEGPYPWDFVYVAIALRIDASCDRSVASSLV